MSKKNLFIASAITAAVATVGTINTAQAEAKGKCESGSVTSYDANSCPQKGMWSCEGQAPKFHPMAFKAGKTFKECQKLHKAFAIDILEHYQKGNKDAKKYLKGPAPEKIPDSHEELLTLVHKMSGGKYEFSFQAKDIKKRWLPEQEEYKDD